MKTIIFLLLVIIITASILNIIKNYVEFKNKKNRIVHELGWMIIKLDTKEKLSDFLEKNKMELYSLFNEVEEIRFSKVNNLDEAEKKLSMLYKIFMTQLFYK